MTEKNTEKITVTESKSTEPFTEEEKKLLLRFITNVDKRVFVLRNLPEVIKGALFSRYSRSAKGLRRLLLDEFILNPEIGFAEIASYAEKSGMEQILAIQKAQEFYDRILDGYGDDSIGELGGAHLAIEDISNIATKFIQDCRIGGSPLEKSTRYIYFNDKVDGKYRFLREQTIMESEFAELYESTCNMLFDTYSVLVPKMVDFFTSKFPRARDTSDRAYNFSIRARACDALRGLLPASTLTNMGVFGNGRFFENLIIKMRCHELAEIRLLADESQEELDKVIPSFVRRSRPEHKHFSAFREFIASREIALRKITENAMDKTESTAENIIISNISDKSGNKPSGVELVDYDNLAEEKIVASSLYAYSSLPMHKIREKVHSMSSEERLNILKTCVANRSNRRHKPPRSFENAYYTFDILADYGAYRDLHRHRMLTQERQELSIEHGYELPPEIIEAGCEAEFCRALETAADSYKKIKPKFPRQAQYIVPFAYRIRWYMTVNLRSAFWFSELRSIAQGHPSYRKIAQEIYLRIREVHPALADLPNFVDMQDYELGRLEQEKKNAEKKVASY